MKAAFLWAALAFATSTIFVRDAWAVLYFQAAICLLWLLVVLREPGAFTRPWVLAIPAVGLLQLACGTSIYPEATLLALLHWLALAAVYWLARDVAAARFVNWFLGFASFEAVLCLAQLHTSNGRILWLIPSGYEDYVYGTFHSYNNFAQFAELAIPIAIVRALERRRQAGWFVLACGLLYAAVIASTSRSGAILATLELLAIPSYLVLRRGFEWKRAALVLAAVPALAGIWTGVAGWDRMAQRFAAGDLAAGRREFLLSAVDMALDKPLAGHGLGTFVWAYPRFARIDLPEIVNHAHNDWAEFAAEGGLLFPLLVFGLFVYSSRRLFANPWSWGVVAVLIHSAVDFPFARPGVSGWLFAILGIVAGPPGAVAAASIRWWRWPVAPAAAAGAAAALWLGCADVAFVVDTPESLRRAAAMNPWHAGYRFRLFEQTRNFAALDAAMRLNPHDASTLIEAGLRAELNRDPRRALQLLLEAARLDKGWLPRWTLANFHLRAGETDEFWRWGKAAAAVSRGIELRPLFQLAANLEPDTGVIAQQLLPETRPEPLRGFIQFLILSKPKETRGLDFTATRLLQAGAPQPDRNYVVSAVERFLEIRDPDTSWSLWNKLLEQGWLPAGAGQGFALAPPLREGFDWRTYPIEGIVLSPDPGLMTVSLSGKQTEASWPALQRIARVAPQERYRLQVDYTTEGITEPSGLRWRVSDEVSGEELALTEPLPSAEPQSRRATVDFTAPPGKLVRLQLVCRRDSGGRRATGSIRFSGADLTLLEAESQP